MSKKVYSSSVDREVKSLHRNSIHEKRLSEENKKVDLHLRRETKLTERQKAVLMNDRKVIEAKSPTVSEWKKQHQTTYDSWKEREREKINKRYRSMKRHSSLDLPPASISLKGQRSVESDDTNS